MIPRRIKSALPRETINGTERVWICLLDCGHETVAVGAIGKRPQGGIVPCKYCPEVIDVVTEAPTPEPGANED